MDKNNYHGYVVAKDQDDARRTAEFGHMHNLTDACTIVKGYELLGESKGIYKIEFRPVEVVSVEKVALSTCDNCGADGAVACAAVGIESALCQSCKSVST